ncbi:MAG: fimbrillin family protein, partial [Tannerella sp.]|nr:fimbrillin family protein [Tannerella sp.]
GTGLVDSDFADITATMSGMPVKAGFSLSDRQFVPEGNLAFPMRRATTASGSIATFDAVVIPGTGGTRRVTFRLNGNEYNWTVPVADIFQPGKRYTYAITLKVS